MKKTVDPAGANIVTQYLYDGDQVIAEYDGSSVLQRRYLYHPGAGIDEPFVYIDESGGSRVFFSYHSDHQGSVVAMSDETGKQIEAYSYSPYGVASITTPTTGQPYRYTGRRFDIESGLYYYRARYYHTGLGRFLQTDPIGYGDNLNLYAYTGNDPMNNTDPSGEITLGGNFAINFAAVAGGKFSVELAFDFKTGEVRAQAVFGDRLGLKGGAKIGVFAEPSKKIGNKLSGKLTAVGVLKAEINFPLVGGAEASLTGVLGGQISTSSEDSGFVANVTPSASANLGPISVDDTGRSSIEFGADLGGSVGQDVTVDVNISIPDAIDAVKKGACQTTEILC